MSLVYAAQKIELFDDYFPETTEEELASIRELRGKGEENSAKARLLLHFAQLLIGDMSPRAGG